MQLEIQPELGLHKTPVLLSLHSLGVEHLPASLREGGGHPHLTDLSPPRPSPSPPQHVQQGLAPDVHLKHVLLPLLGNLSVKCVVPAGPGTVMSQNNGKGRQTKRDIE